MIDTEVRLRATVNDVIRTSRDLGTEAGWSGSGRPAPMRVTHHVGKLGSPGFEVTLVRITEPDPDGTGQTQAL